MAVDSWGRTKKMDLLGQMSLFSACTRRELGQVAALTVGTELRSGAVLTRQGVAGALAYVIASGHAEVTRNGRRLATVGPGAVVGELSLIDGEPRSATVRASTDLEVLEIAKRDLDKMLRRVPSVRRKLLESLAGRLRATDTLS